MQRLLKKSAWMGLSSLLLAACARSTYTPNGTGSPNNTGQTEIPVLVQDTTIHRPATPQTGRIRPAGVQTPSVQVPDAER